MIDERDFGNVWESSEYWPKKSLTDNSTSFSLRLWHLFLSFANYTSNSNRAASTFSVFLTDFQRGRLYNSFICIFKKKNVCLHITFELDGLMFKLIMTFYTGKDSFCRWDGHGSISLGYKNNKSFRLSRKNSLLLII